MAIFSKSKPETPAQRAATPLRIVAGESAISIIGAGMRIEGDIVTDGTVRVEGQIKGTIRAGKAVVLGKDAEVVGDIHTQDAVVGGRVVGTLVVESRLELQATSVVEGSIRASAAHLKLDEGARFNGQIEMIEAPVAPALPAPEGEKAAAKR